MVVRYVSHEIRTPLNTISLGLRLLSRHIKSKSYQLSLTCVKEIELSTQIALDVVNDMLICDKIQSQNLVLEKVFVKPLEFCRDAVKPMLIQVRDLYAIQLPLQ